jgi:tetratricopeptide (TPR) repeat protein
MAPIIDSCNGRGVDEATLTGTGRGGILASGYLRDGSIESYLDENEKPVHALSNDKKGVSRGRLDGPGAGDVEWLRPGDGYRAFAVVTDARLLFIVGDIENGSGDHVARVPLAGVEVVEVDSGLLATELAVTTALDVRWRFPCTGDVGDVVDYLDAASMVWMDVERHLDAARSKVVTAAECIEKHDHHAGIDAVRDAMSETDAARRRERELCEAGVAAMNERLERMEARVEDVHVRVLEARATHNMDRAETRWREGDYDAAHAAFTGAHDDFAEALSLGDHDFADSEQLRERLARVERNLAALERAPVEHAEDRCERGHEVDALAERAALFEEALDSYRTALELDWGRSAKRFHGDTEEIRERIDALASDLVETRRRLAADRVRQADEDAEVGRYPRAVERYREAREALEAAEATARELAPDALSAVTEHIAAIESRLDDLGVGEGFLMDELEDDDGGAIETAMGDADDLLEDPDSDVATDDRMADSEDSQTPLYSPT